ncbi:DUF2585 domain-containing protein [Ciceribacter ferrooxidans]|uniref:UPF0314 protein EUU22_21675 n=1 Tax=Ciceribacter ferrooxidans TaxID=2509717 RepID=A0A4Q2SH10_9HYPH|nr:DUF2585 domain-containing protein [Ciceribacter ferrooxidans]RYC04755.1 DUF2585 domain-containing protein [Ciceribacter ferrooxidans]
MTITALDPQDRYKATRLWLFAVGLTVLAQIGILHLMGRIPICECGYIKFFEPGVNTAGNSQHLADWYTPSHIIHGFLFYLLAFVLFRRRPLSMRLAFATLIEAAWELVENSPLVIDRYRTATMAIGYQGDSILNSTMDTLFMVVGFLFAARAPVWLTVSIAVFLEIYVGWLIRDNLTLNVLMLLWPIEAIRVWQAGL